MDFSGIGGIAVAVIAGLWLIVFVPAHLKADREEQPLTQKALIASRPMVREVEPEQLRRLRLLTTARVSNLIALVALASSAAVVVVSRLSAMNLLWLGLSVPLLLGSLALARKANQAASQIGKQSQRKPQMSEILDFDYDISKVRTKPAFDRSWTPVQLPQPLSNRAGELRNLAPVASFEAAKSAVASNVTAQTVEQVDVKPEIDVLEILRRRRAI